MPKVTSPVRLQICRTVCNKIVPGTSLPRLVYHVTNKQLNTRQQQNALHLHFRPHQCSTNSFRKVQLNYANTKIKLIFWQHGPDGQAGGIYAFLSYSFPEIELSVTKSDVAFFGIVRFYCQCALSAFHVTMLEKVKRGVSMIYKNFSSTVTFSNHSVLSIFTTGVTKHAIC
jgi:hypothetical protein